MLTRLAAAWIVGWRPLPYAVFRRLTGCVVACDGRGCRFARRGRGLA